MATERTPPAPPPRRALLRCPQRLAAQRQSRLVFLEKLRDPRIQVPAQVIEPRLPRPAPHLVERTSSPSAEIRPPRPPPARRCCQCSFVLRRAARRGAAAAQALSPSAALRRCPMCAALFGIDVGVLDDRPWARRRWRRAWAPARARHRRGEKRRALEEEIHVVRRPPVPPGHAGDRRRAPVAISCAICLGARRSRFASSNAIGVATSPMATFGGRCVTTEISWTLCRVRNSRSAARIQTRRCDHVISPAGFHPRAAMGGLPQKSCHKKDGSSQKDASSQTRWAVTKEMGCHKEPSNDYRERLLRSSKGP